MKKISILLLLVWLVFACSSETTKEEPLIPPTYSVVGR